MIEYEEDFNYQEYPQDAETFLLDQAAKQLAAKRRAHEETSNMSNKSKQPRGRPPIAKLQPPKTKASFTQAPATSTPKILEKEFNKLNAAKQEQYVRAYWQGDIITPIRDQLFKPKDEKPTLVPAEQEVARGKAKESATNSLVKKLLATEVSATIEDENTIDTYLVDKSTLIVKALENITVPPSSTKSYQTGIIFDIPKGHLLEVSSISKQPLKGGICLKLYRYYPGFNHQLQLELENPKETTQGIAEKEVMAVLSMRLWESSNKKKPIIPYKWLDHQFTTTNERKYCPRTKVKIKDKLVIAYIDNGLGLSFISEQLAESLRIKVNDTRRITFLTVNREDQSRGVTKEVSLSTRRISIR
ncbi:hypothetical protein CONCODRAFT_74572 [Conidiobolus coronatus NRRL 28638]|uniref:Uncharacterized protein n=1 Tax=Conidiobolus coronatus (strain ATCC 28846 / CBS 209.66 / NRRL 28638) TaxID=796925 RepID=A0A137NQ59_CONC2|nr:hypothetical protein CONCODRAFT_74572 [Conidiobolus coronatus NRRL 28638]|eukprot:KXN64882.1 hypothetical protein CONCODRAFT_74572 [Conidiobolus coronatus NRRL 28638]